MGASVVAGGDAAPVLEFGEQVPDLVALPVESFVVGIRPLAAPQRRNAGIDAPDGERIPEPGTVLAPVDDQASRRRQGIEDEAGNLKVAHLAFRQHHDDRPALAVADGVELGIQAAFRAPDTTGNSPFLSRLAAVRWTLR